MKPYRIPILRRNLLKCCLYRWIGRRIPTEFSSAQLFHRWQTPLRSHESRLDEIQPSFFLRPRTQEVPTRLLREGACDFTPQNVFAPEVNGKMRAGIREVVLDRAIFLKLFAKI
jgi:hypothetical protein